MSVKKFEQDRERTWSELEAHLMELEKRKGRRKQADVTAVPGLFRQVCADLALAQYRMYGLKLCDRLNDLVIRTYKLLYRGGQGSLTRALEFFWTGFPNAFRKEWRLFAFCTAVFLLPALGLIFSAEASLTWIQATLGPEGMADMDGMYAGDSQVEFLRNKFGSDFQMFAFYIFNNVGIDFRTFASGLLCGVGTLFILFFNGLYLGAAAGYVNYAGHGQNFYTFVVGHAALELVGMLISGMAGMRLGLAILRPGRMTRREALVQAGHSSIKLLYGAAVMTVLAAFVEGFWSPRPFDPTLKYAAGGFMALLLMMYLTFAGRRASTDAA